MAELSIKLLTEHATIPTRGSQQAAGLDLYSAYDLEIEPHGKAIIKTDIAMVIPFTYYGRIAPRSGMSWKNHTDIGAGVIDSDYRGNIGVVMFNHSNVKLNIKRGDRVAQLILEKICYPTINIIDSLSTTERGNNGYGSTG